MHANRLLLLLAIALICSDLAWTQEPDSGPATLTDLQRRYPAPELSREVQIDFSPEVYDPIAEKQFSLTASEKEMLHRQGMMVSERLAQRTFLEQFISVWRKDVPVYVSADVVLRAFHYNYIDLLTALESNSMRPQLQAMLEQMHQGLPDLAARYDRQRELDQSLRDIDVYLTVANRLLGIAAKPVEPYFPENDAIVTELIGHIMRYQPAKLRLFSGESRPVDFSQFEPRGHYAHFRNGKPNVPMANYFRTMMWLGRCSFVISREKHSPLGFRELSDEDLRRQAADAALLVELLQQSDSDEIYDDLQSHLTFLVGPADSLSVQDLRNLFEQAGVTGPTDLFISDVSERLARRAQANGIRGEQIASRFVLSHRNETSVRKPAYVFQLLGQRFTIDSYILSNVVYGQVKPEPGKPARVIPSTQDLLFALGNNESLGLLGHELERYGYAPNLASVREHVDAIPTTFWRSSVYGRWQHCIRLLNPPPDVSALPAFMQTRAYWRQKMNTQLASWTQLRHDHLLYAKSSYTDTFGCSYPHGYVEPFPQLYSELHDLASVIEIQASKLKDHKRAYARKALLTYAQHMADVSQTLESIATKELAKEPLSEAETKFLKEVVYAGGYGILRGWYVKLICPDYDGGMFATNNYDRLKDYIVADYHTAPTDEDGHPTGRVCHAGTGKADMALVAVESCDGKTIVYAGPVMSYYECTTEGFERLSDEAWSEKHLAESDRPDWTASFLIDRDGQPRVVAE